MCIKNKVEKSFIMKSLEQHINESFHTKWDIASDTFTKDSAFICIIENTSIQFMSEADIKDAFQEYTDDLKKLLSLKPGEMYDGIDNGVHIYIRFK